MDKANKLELQTSLQPPSELRRVRQVRFGRPGSTSVVQEAFDMLAQRLHARYLAMTPPTFHDMWMALESARVEISAGGAISEAQSQQLKECLARDLNHLAAIIARGSLRAIDDLHRAAAAKGHCGALRYLLEVLDVAGVGVYRISGDARASAVRRAEELTCAGNLLCVQCGHTTASTRSRIVEPCSECGGRAFFRSP